MSMSKGGGYKYDQKSKNPRDGTRSKLIGCVFSWIENVMPSATVTVRQLIVSYIYIFFKGKTQPAGGASLFIKQHDKASSRHWPTWWNSTPTHHWLSSAFLKSKTTGTFPSDTKARMPSGRVWRGLRPPGGRYSDQEHLSHRWSSSSSCFSPTHFTRIFLNKWKKKIRPSTSYECTKWW